MNELKSKDLRIRTGHKIIRAILTSYEIVWATLRMEPKRAYFEFLAQPHARVE